MSEGLKIASGFALPDDAVTQAMAILARRGAGKTYTASVIAEEMLGKHYPIVWLDPLGVAWGLRTGFPVVIFGGDHADIPLNIKDGSKIADLIVSERFPAIVDVSELEEDEMIKFVGDFADRFYRKNRLPVHLFLDEADIFAPQSGGGRNMSKCSRAMHNIVRRGRARGIGCTMITQRHAVLDKSLLSQAEALIAMQTPHPRDLKAIDEWFSAHVIDDVEKKKVMKSIPALSQGEAYFYSPGWIQKFKKIKIRKRKTYDSSATPDLNQAKHKPKKFKAVDLDRLKKAIGLDDESLEQAPSMDKALQNAQARKIAALEAEVAALNKSLLAGQSERLALTKSNAELQEKLKRISGIAIFESPVIQSLTHTIKPIASKQSSPPAKPASEAAASPILLAELDSLPKAQKKILQALFWLSDEEVTKKKVGFYSGYKAGSGSFNNALSGLRSLGYVDGWNITEAGVSVIAVDTAPKPSGSDLREWLRPKLGKAENALLSSLIDVYPERMGVDFLAESSGYAPRSGSFNNALSKLRSLGAAEGGAKDGGVMACEIFFT